jgi:hypothetical protein
MVPGREPKDPAHGQVPVQSKIYPKAHGGFNHGDSTPPARSNSTDVPICFTIILCLRDAQFSPFPSSAVVEDLCISGPQISAIVGAAIPLQASLPQRSSELISMWSVPSAEPQG